MWGLPGWVLRGEQKEEDEGGESLYKGADFAHFLEGPGSLEYSLVATASFTSAT